MTPAPVLIKSILDQMQITRHGFDARIQELWTEDPFCGCCGKLIEDFKSVKYASEFDGMTRQLKEFVVHDGCSEALLSSQLERSLNQQRITK